MWRQKKEGCDKDVKPPKSTDTGRPHEGHPSLGGRCWSWAERNLPFLARRHMAEVKVRDLTPKGVTVEVVLVGSGE